MRRTSSSRTLRVLDSTAAVHERIRPARCLLSLHRSARPARALCHLRCGSGGHAHLLGVDRSRRSARACKRSRKRAARCSRSSSGSSSPSSSPGSSRASSPRQDWPWVIKIGIGTIALASFLFYQWVVGRRAARSGETGDLDEFEAGARPTRRRFKRERMPAASATGIHVKDGCYFLSKSSLYVKPAISAPTMGATINTHTWPSASGPP